MPRRREADSVDGARRALAPDVSSLVFLAARMHRESPAYRDFGFDEDKVAAALHRLVAGEGCVIVFELGGLIVAGFVAIIVDSWFSSDRTACDLALFVEPITQSTCGTRHR